MALEGAEVATGMFATLRELTNPERKLPFPRHEVTREFLFTLNQDLFLISFRTTNKGAAGCPSWMTADHFFPVLDNERGCALVLGVCDLSFGGVLAGGVWGVLVGGV